jgi:pimeloyl-ACP methyl ester carboxylesterase
VPFEAIDVIVRWLGKSAAPFAPAQAHSVALRGVQQGGEWRESIIALETGMFGILSEPLQAGSNGAPTIVLPNAGAAHHAGPNRLYVLLSRALSRAGFRCVRFDLPGLGDSFVEGAEENEPYPRDASDCIGEMLEALERRAGGDSFVLAGLCSGAHASFHAALDLERAPILEAVLINPLAFYYKPGMPLDQPSVTRYREWNWYMRSARRVDRWAKLFRGRARISRILRAVSDRVRDTLVSLRNSIRRERRARPRPGDLPNDLQRIVHSGRKLTFVFARFAPGYDILMHKAAGTVRRLRRQGLIRLLSIADANHTFEGKRCREAMIHALVEHLSRRYL